MFSLLPVSGTFRRDSYAVFLFGLQETVAGDCEAQPQLTRADKGWCNTLRLAVAREEFRQRKEREREGCSRLVARANRSEEGAHLRQLDELVEVSACCAVDCRSR